MEYEIEIVEGEKAYVAKRCGELMKKGFVNTGFNTVARPKGTIIHSVYMEKLISND